MVWNYTTRDVPYLRDYAAAAEHEAKVKPIRGRKVECKPLGDRRKAYIAIRRDEFENIIIGYHNHGEPAIDIGSTLLIFRPNGEIILRGDHRSTALAVQARVLGTEIITRYGVNWVWAMAPGEDGGDVHRGWWPIRDNCRTHNPKFNTPDNHKAYGTPAYEPYYVYDMSKMSVMRREADGRLRYVNVTYPAVHRINRAAMNAARKEYGDFLKFARGVTKLYGLGETIDLRVPAGIFGMREDLPAHNPRALSRYDIAIPRLTPAEVLVLASVGSAERWRELAVWAHFTPNVTGNIWWRANLWDADVAEKVLRRALLNVRRDTLLHREVVMAGKIVKDPNPEGLWR